MPSFKETLKGYRDEWFFESDNPESLAMILNNIAEGHIDLIEQISVIEKLNHLYSLESFANDTIKVYKSTMFEK